MAHHHGGWILLGAVVHRIDFHRLIFLLRHVEIFGDCANAVLMVAGAKLQYQRGITPPGCCRLLIKQNESNTFLAGLRASGFLLWLPVKSRCRVCSYNSTTRLVVDYLLPVLSSTRTGMIEDFDDE